MSDTPFTDNLARGNHVVPTEFAQDLERQLRAARDKCHQQRMSRLAGDKAYAEMCHEAEEQARLLAMSADREEKLRAELQQTRDCFYVAMELAKGYKAERDAIP